MEKLQHGMDDESCFGSDDLVEYTLEEQEEEPVIENPASAEDSEELVEISSIPAGNTDEEVDTYVKNSINIADVRNHGNALNSGTLFNATNVHGGKYKNKITVLSQSSTSAGRMKLLNSTQTTLPSGTATTSYRLIHTDGTVVMNLAQSQAMKKVISIANPNLKQQTDSKATLNQNSRLLQIQPQNSASTLGTVMKTVTIPKNALAMKAIPASAFKTVSQASTSTSTGVQKAIVHMAKVGGQTASVAYPRITNTTSPTAIKEDRKVIVRPSNAMSIKKVATTNVQQRYVPGIKGVQYVRVLNHQAAPGSSAGTKMIFPTVNKVAQVPFVESESAAAGNSKIFVQNSRTYVVRNGIGKVTTSIGGKPSVLSTTRKIILGGTGGQSLDQYMRTTSRTTLKNEDIDSNPLRNAITNQSQTANNPTSIMNDTIKVEDDKQKHNKIEARFTSRDIEMDEKIMEVETDSSRKNTAYGFPEEAYKKRPCNCTKSQCLKLYCDCFANGEFCYNCNCKDCYNTIEHENERQKAIRCTLERNPNAFKPKIGSIGSTDDGTRLHTKGCNCKRSGCLKNYCECYEAKIPCSSNCKCIGCRNTDQFALEFNYFGTPDLSTKQTDDSAMLQVSGKNNVIYSNADSVASESQITSSSSCGLKRAVSVIDTDISELPASKQPHNFMTLDVIEATVQCMVAQADECIKRGCSIRTSERMILEEYGRCLLEIKEFAFKTDN